MLPNCEHSPVVRFKHLDITGELLIHVSGLVTKQTTKRTGWVNHGVKESESIADHMYRMAIMAMISGDLPGVNKDR